MITWRPRQRLAGSTDIVDRDLQRIENDIVAIERRYPTTRSKAARWFRTRVAPGTHSPA